MQPVEEKQLEGLSREEGYPKGAPKSLPEPFFVFEKYKQDISNETN